MGACCSCCGAGDDGEMEAKELELQQREARKALSISKKMSAPTVRTNDRSATGNGLALVSVSLDQDAAYWEWHISIAGGSVVDNILFGVSSRKDQKFFESKDEEKSSQDEDPCQANGTQWMRCVEVRDGDVVGIAMQQSDLPMLQLMLNGEILHLSSINRFKGIVYPSILLPAQSDDDSTKLSVDFVPSEEEFKFSAPGAKYVPIMVARSIV